MGLQPGKAGGGGGVGEGGGGGGGDLYHGDLITGRNELVETKSS